MIQPKEDKNHFYWIDLIRFSAALMVVLSHYRGAFFIEYGLLEPGQQNTLMFIFYSITRMGHESVLIFFVLSGFLVGGKGIQRINGNQFEFKSYLIDRSVRIMLPLISALLLIAIVNYVIGKDTDIFDWLGNLFSLQGILVNSVSDPLWSLSYEVWFYIALLAFALLINKNKKLSKSGFIIILLCIVVFTKLRPTYLFIWLIGAFSFLIAPRKTNFLKIFSLLILIVIGLTLLQLTSGSKSIEISGIMSYIPNRDILELLFSILFALLLINIVILIPRSGFMISLNNAGSKLAAFSYTLYLTHFPLLELMRHLGFPKSEKINLVSVSLFLLEITIALAFAWLIYFFFEKRTAFVKQKIKSITT